MPELTLLKICSWTSKTLRIIWIINRVKTKNECIKIATIFIKRGRRTENRNAWKKLPDAIQYITNAWETFFFTTVCFCNTFIYIARWYQSFIFKHCIFQSLIAFTQSNCSRYTVSENRSSIAFHQKRLGDVNSRLPGRPPQLLKVSASSRRLSVLRCVRQPFHSFSKKCCRYRY